MHNGDGEEPMSDYESGSPPSRGELDAANSMSMYSTSPAMHKRKSSPGPGIVQRINPANKRHSTGNTLDYDYQIKELSLDKRKILKHHNEESEFPDLKPSINYKFSNTNYSSKQTNYENGFDFGDKYRLMFEEHKKSLDEFQKVENIEQSTVYANGTNIPELANSASSLNEKNTQVPNHVPSIWCMDYQENLIVVGCANGSLEFWEGTTGKFKVIKSNYNR